MSTLIQYFTVPIKIVHSSTDNADTAPFAMLLTTPGRYIRLASYELQVTYNAAAASPSTETGYWLNRFTTAVPAGGTAVVPVPDDLSIRAGDTASLATGVTNCRIKQDGALTMTSVANFPIALFGTGIGITGESARFAFDFGDYGPIARVNVGFNLTQLETVVAGKSISGFIRYAEYFV